MKKLYAILAIAFVGTMMCGCSVKQEPKTVDEFFEQIKPKTEKIESISFNLESKTPDTVLNSKIFIKGENAKIESEVEINGKKNATISIYNNENIMSYAPNSKMVIKVKKTKTPFALKNFANEDLSKYKLDEHTKINGYSCQMLVDEALNEYCISDEYGIMVYAKEKNNHGEVESNVSDIKVNSVSDSLFEIPSGMKIVGF